MGWLVDHMSGRVWIHSLLRLIFDIRDFVVTRLQCSWRERVFKEE
jgi:hypothetical protein